MAAPAGVQHALSGTKPWVRLISILGFISAGFMIVLGGLGALFGSALGEMPPGMSAVFLIYPVMGVVYLVPSLYLFRYASRIGDYLRGGEEGQLQLALETQRSFWRFVGILCVVAIVLSVAMMVVALAIPFVLRSAG
jgi:hypothetical protein